MTPPTEKKSVVEAMREDFDSIKICDISTNELDRLYESLVHDFSRLSHKLMDVDDRKNIILDELKKRPDWLPF